MSDQWLTDGRLIDKVGREEADAIRQAMNSGNVEKWMIKIAPDGSTSVIKIDATGGKLGPSIPF